MDGFAATRAYSFGSQLIGRYREPPTTMDAREFHSLPDGKLRECNNGLTRAQLRASALRRTVRSFEGTPLERRKNVKITRIWRRERRTKRDGEIRPTSKPSRAR